MAQNSPVVATAPSPAATIASLRHPVWGVRKRPRPLPSGPATVRRGGTLRRVAPTATPAVIVVSAIPRGWRVVPGIPVGRVVSGVPVGRVHGRWRPAVAVAAIVVITATIAASAESATTTTLHLSTLVAMACQRKIGNKL
jgi:hypothetical protein